LGSQVKGKGRDRKGEGGIKGVEKKIKRDGGIKGS
jgi:hypothetical protein